MFLINRNGPWLKTNPSNTWTFAWRWWIAPLALRSNCRAAGRMTADRWACCAQSRALEEVLLLRFSTSSSLFFCCRNGSRSTTTPNCGTLAAICVWTAGMRGTAVWRWRCAARRSPSSGSLLSTCSRSSTPPIPALPFSPSGTHSPLRDNRCPDTDSGPPRCGLVVLKGHGATKTQTRWWWLFPSNYIPHCFICCPALGKWILSV